MALSTYGTTHVMLYQSGLFLFVNTKRVHVPDINWLLWITKKNYMEGRQGVFHLSSYHFEGLRFEFEGIPFKK